MPYKKISLTFLILLIASAMGCAPLSSSSSGGESSSQQIARHDQQIRSILAQMGQVENVLPGQAENWSQLQAMRQELDRTQMRLDALDGGGSDGAHLKEQVDRLDALVRKMAKQLGVSTAELDAPSAVANAMPSSYGSTYAAPVRPGSVVIVNHNQTTPTPVSTVAGGSTALYDSGIKSFDQRNYAKAVEDFKGFVAQNPQHNLASNAHFWQGECYYQLKQYQQAVLAYQEVISKYQGSSKYQSSMLKQGLSLYNLDKKDAGKERLDDLVARYPNSPEATRAKNFIKSN